MMKCGNINKKLFAYAEGQLAEEESLLVAEHLEGCSACMGSVEAIKAFLLQVDREKEVEPNPFFFTRLEEAMKVTAPSPGRSVARLVPSFVASLLFIAGIFAGINVGKLYYADREADRQFLSITRPFLDDLSQEPVEAWFVNIYSNGDEAR